MVILDLRKATDFTDYFVLAAGSNQKQIVAIADAVLESHARPGPAADARRGLSARRVDPARLPRPGGARVHASRPAPFYDLERLWGGATRQEVTG